MGKSRHKKRMEGLFKVGQVSVSELSDAGDERLKEQFVKRKYIYGRASQMRQGKKIYMHSARKYK